MAFDYDLTTDAGKVRLNIGDTVEQDYSLNDDEIAHALTLNSSVLGASIIAIEWRLVRLADWIAQSAGGQSAQLNQKYEQLENHYKKLKSRAKRAGGLNAYAGGIEQSRIDTAKADTSFPQQKASVGQDDLLGGTDSDEVRGD